MALRSSDWGHGTRSNQLWRIYAPPLQGANCWLESTPLHWNAVTYAAGVIALPLVVTSVLACLRRQTQL